MEKTGIYQNKTRILKQPMERQAMGIFYGGEPDSGGAGGAKPVTAGSSTLGILYQAYKFLLGMCACACVCV